MNKPNDTKADDINSPANTYKREPTVIVDGNGKPYGVEARLQTGKE